MSVNFKFLGERKILGKLPGVARYSSYTCTSNHTHNKVIDRKDLSTEKLTELASQILVCIPVFEKGCRLVLQHYENGNIPTTSKDQLIRLMNDEIADDKRLLELVQNTIAAKSEKK